MTRTVLYYLSDAEFNYYIDNGGLYGPDYGIFRTSRMWDYATNNAEIRDELREDN